MGRWLTESKTEWTNYINHSVIQPYSLMMSTQKRERTKIRGDNKEIRQERVVYCCLGPESTHRRTSWCATRHIYFTHFLLPLRERKLCSFEEIVPQRRTWLVEEGHAASCVLKLFCIYNIWYLRCNERHFIYYASIRYLCSLIFLFYKSII